MRVPADLARIVTGIAVTRLDRIMPMPGGLLALLRATSIRRTPCLQPSHRSRVRRPSLASLGHFIEASVTARA